MSVLIDGGVFMAGAGVFMWLFFKGIAEIERASHWKPEAKE